MLYVSTHDHTHHMYCPYSHINEDRRKTEGQMQMFEVLRDIEDCPVSIAWLYSVDIHVHSVYMYMYIPVHAICIIPFVLQATLLSAQRSFLRRVDVVDIGNPSKGGKGDSIAMFLFSDSIEVKRSVALRVKTVFVNSVT